MFAVAQFYHFAFLSVSLALLGFGASGSALATFPRLGGGGPRRWASRAAGHPITPSTNINSKRPFTELMHRLSRCRQIWGTGSVGAPGIHGPSMRVASSAPGQGGIETGFSQSG